MSEEVKTLKRSHISFSEYRLWLTCPFKHYVQKVLGLQEPSNEFLIFGSALHGAIEEIIKKKPNKIVWSKVFEKYLVLESNEVVLNSYFGRIFGNQGAAILKELNFFERYKGWEIVGVEMEMYEPLYIDGEHEVFFKGVVDLILKKGDKILILDWKSAFKPWDIEKKKQDKTFFGQLALYKHFYSTKFNVPLENIETRFVALARDPINVQQYNIELSSEFMEFILNDIVQVAKNIKSTDPLKLTKARADINSKFACTNCFYNKKHCNKALSQPLTKEDIDAISLEVAAKKIKKETEKEEKTLDNA